MKIIFGLGNPGRKYKNNRHNIGYMVADEAVCAQKIKFRKNFKLAASIAGKISIDEEIVFVKPRTFMNNSGVCVKKVLENYKCLVSDILIVYDDVDLPLGEIRFRRKGCGGHRGMRSVKDMLKTEHIDRLRIGIDKAEVEDLSEYVLSDFDAQEKDKLEEVIKQGAAALMDWVKYGADFVMRNYNRRGGQ